MLGPRLPIAARVLASAVFIAVAVDRWGPCASAGYDRAVCLQRQDDSSVGVGTLLGLTEAPLLALGGLLVAAAIVLAARSGRLGLALLAAALPIVQALPVLAPGLGYGLLLVVLTLAIGPLAGLVSGGYVSHDSNPWTWLPAGLGCLAAAVALGVARREPAPAAAGALAVA